MFILQKKHFSELFVIILAIFSRVSAVLLPKTIDQKRFFKAIVTFSLLVVAISTWLPLHLGASDFFICLALAISTLVVGWISTWEPPDESGKAEHHRTDGYL